MGDASKADLEKPHLPPELWRPGNASRLHPTIFSCICSLLIFPFLFLLGVFLFLLLFGFLIPFNPTGPSFRVENVAVPFFNISSRSDGTYLDATVTVKIRAINPNSKLGLSYGAAAEARVGAKDEDGEVELGEVDLGGGFRLAAKNSTAIGVRVTANGVLVDDSVGERLRRRFDSGEIEFVVRMRMKVGFVIGGRSMAKWPVRVNCAPVSLKQIRTARWLPMCDSSSLGMLD